MTFISIPLNRLAATVALFAGLVVAITGCTPGEPNGSAGSTPPSAAATPTAAPVTVETVGTRLPDSAELDALYSKQNYCGIGIPDVEACPAAALVPGAIQYWLSNGYNLRPGASSLTAGAVSMGVTSFASHDDAEAQAEKVRTDDAKYGGEFDIPVTDNAAGGRNVGQRGSGVVSDFTQGAWSGSKLIYASENVGEDGNTYPADSEFGGAQATVVVTATQGPLTFVLRLYFASAEDGVAETEAMTWVDQALGVD